MVKHARLTGLLALAACGLHAANPVVQWNAVAPPGLHCARFGPAKSCLAGEQFAGTAPAPGAAGRAPAAGSAAAGRSLRPLPAGASGSGAGARRTAVPIASGLRSPSGAPASGPARIRPQTPARRIGDRRSVTPQWVKACSSRGLIRLPRRGLPHSLRAWMRSP
jgi:hypothetical protein